SRVLSPAQSSIARMARTVTRPRHGPQCGRVRSYRGGRLLASRRCCYALGVRVPPPRRRALSQAPRLLSPPGVSDRAAEVAEEKLFGPGPRGAPHALGAFGPQGELLGVASVGGSRIRLLAVDPAARRRGVGGALLAACCDAARDDGATGLRTLD